MKAFRSQMVKRFALGSVIFGVLAGMAHAAPRRSIVTDPVPVVIPNPTPIIVSAP